MNKMSRVFIVKEEHFIATTTLYPVYVPHGLSASIQMDYNTHSFYIWIVICRLPCMATFGNDCCCGMGIYIL